MNGTDLLNRKNVFQMESLTAFSAYVLGLLGVLAGRFVFGLDWVPSLLLYVPCHGLACGIANNEARRIVDSLVLLLLFPLISSVVSELLLRSSASAGGTHLTRTMTVALGAFASVVSFGGVLLAAHFVSSVFGGWRLSHRVHAVCVRAEVIIACTLAMSAMIFVLRMLGTWGLHVSPVLRLVISLLLGVGYAFCVRGVLRAPVGVSETSVGFRRLDIHPEKRGKPSKSAQTAPAVREVTPPSVRLADVAGMEEVKRQIRLRLIEPVRDAAQARRYGISVGGGMLLYGPPGTGKTFIAKAVAGELGLPFYAITAADVFGKYVGESEGNIRRIFEEIRRHPLSVVFIDELETLFPKRTAGAHDSALKVISVLLQELDGIESGKNPILLLGATNVPWMVDEAFMRPGRFDVRVFVGLPDFAARRQMFISAFAKGSVPHASGLTAYLAERTENYSGADINGVMARLRQTAYERRMPAYTAALAEEVLAVTAPSATGEILDQIREWEATSVGEKGKNAIRGGTSVAERPTVTLKDVAGMADVKEQVRLRLIEPMTHRTLAGRYGLTVGGGMLLYGPPGTGKTFFARAVAGELDLPFYMVTAADIFGKYVGESERNVRKLFNDIRKNPLSVVFIDELETIFPKRTDEVHETTRKVISLLLQELDGIDKSKNPILLLGATNVPWLVDEAFLRPGRFDVKVYVGLPDFDARRQMLITAFAAGNVPHEPGLTAHMAERTEGFSGADLCGVMARMRQIAFDRRLSQYTYVLADEILELASPTTSDELVRRIRDWESA